MAAWLDGTTKPSPLALRTVNPDALDAVLKAHAQVSEGMRAAECSLGVMYASGWGVERDYGRALELFERSAAQGHAEAQVRVYMYRIPTLDLLAFLEPLRLGLPAH